MFDTLEEIVRLCELDGDTAQRLQTVIFDGGQRPEPLPALEADSAAVLLGTMKDLLYQTFIRREKLLRTLRMRRFFARQGDDGPHATCCSATYRALAAGQSPPLHWGYFHKQTDWSAGAPKRAAAQSGGRTAMAQTALHTRNDTEFAPDAPFGDAWGPALMGPFAPVADESVWDRLEVHGEIPADLNGVYLRNGPNPRFAPQGRYHPFDGDGMIHAAHFADGRVVYRNRWVRTDAWQEEDRAGQATYYGIRETLKGRTDKRLKDAANTDVIGHGGIALASWYMSGDIYMLDPITLETLGKAPYAKRHGGGFSAHSKVDEQTGELMFFDYWNEAPYMSYGVVAADGTVKNHVPIELPGPRLPHDMAITEHYSILHDLPLFHDEAAMALGRHKLRFHPEMPTRFGVIPRHGAAHDIRWFEFSPCFLYHVVNAWEEGDEVVMVACRYMPERTASGDIDAERTARNIAELKMRSRLWRWRMNMKTGETREEQLDDRYNIEFPSLRAEQTGRKTRWGYVVDHDPDILHWTGIRKFNTDTGECVGEFSDGAAHTWYSEPWFAPADGGTREDDGYVVAFAWNQADRQQQLQVFDARDLSAGPVARVMLPRRVPVGFHACWIAQKNIGRARSA